MVALLSTTVVLGAGLLAAVVHGHGDEDHGAATECLDDGTWMKLGGPEFKTCEWVGLLPLKRCKVWGAGAGTEAGFRVMASEACPVVCGNCEINPCADAPLREDLGNIACVVAAAQSAIDITVGAVGMKDPALDPIVDYSAAGMCTVNVHWHLGAEHKSMGEFDETYAFDHPDLPVAGPEHTPRVGHMCKVAKELWESGDDLVANEYDWQYCKDMHVGLSYEIHWPHSNLGYCQSMWQYQSPFMDGVLCHATVGALTIGEASDAIMSGAAAIGVEGQVFTIVNSADPTTSPYLRSTWDPMNGMDMLLATDYASYQGSTTGDEADNMDCRGTGGLVSWHVDRHCHLVEARTIDNLCRSMLLLPHDDLADDVHPHGSRETVIANYSDTPYTDPQ